MTPVEAALAFGALVGGAIWVGGFVCVAVVARIARAQLGPRERVGFFRALGRRWGAVSLPALAVALACGAALLARGGWDTGATVAAVVAAALVASTVAGVMQARHMTRVRARTARTGGVDDAPVLRRGAATALVLRGLIGIFTLALAAIAAGLVG